jgi:hypothetical protein
MDERTTVAEQAKRIAHSIIKAAVLDFGNASRAAPTEQLRAVQLEGVISDHILRTLNACSGNISVAAEVLAVDRRTLQRALRSRNSHWKVRRGARKPWTPERRLRESERRKRKIDPARIAALRDQNMSWREIAAELNCHHEGARQAYLRYTGRWPKDR